MNFSAENRNSEDEIIMDASTEERARMLNRFRPSNRRVVPVIDSSKCCRLHFCLKKIQIWCSISKKVTMNFYRVVSSAGSNLKATRTRRRTATVTHPISSPGWGIWTRCRPSCRARPRRERKAEFAFHRPFAPFTVDEPLMVIVTWHLLAASVSSF